MGLNSMKRQPVEEADWGGGWGSGIHSFSQSFSQPSIFLWHLLCARSWAMCWGCPGDQHECAVCPHVTKLVSIVFRSKIL